MDRNSNVRPVFQRLKEMFKLLFSNETHIMDATKAFSRTAYGINTDRETIIKKHQHQINSLIRYKIDTNCFEYCCVYPFHNDTEPYIKEILAPFEEKGYKVINISDKISELKNNNSILYLISWYKKELKK